MPVSVKTVRSLELLLRKECKLYEKYITLLNEERGFITHFNAAKVSDLTLKRAAVYEDMLKAQDIRLELMRNFPEPQGKKLRELISINCTPEDKKILLPMAENLKFLVQQAQMSSKEQSQILGFGLKMVHGVLSLFWSATQNVVHSYSRKGKTKESYNPQSRTSNILKRA